MTLLARTATHLAEYTTHGGGLLTIAREDGKCVGFRGKGIAGDFRACLKTHKPQEVVDTYLRIASSLKCEWGPLYKASAMPSLLKPSLKQ